jgi:hypothetical protein
MKKIYCLPADKLLDIYSESKLSKKTVNLFLFFFKRYFKSEIFIEIPKNLQQFDLKMIETIKLASKSQLYWNFNIKKIKTQGRSKPFIFCYHATIGSHPLSIEGHFFTEQEAFEKCIMGAISKVIINGNNNIFIGKSSHEAAAKGILEIVSQYAFREALEKQKTLQEINLDYLIEQDIKITQIIRRLKVYDLNVSFYLLPTKFRLYTILSIVTDKRNQKIEFDFGLSSALDLRSAIVESASKAQTKRTFQKEKSWHQPEKKTTTNLNKIVYRQEAKNCINLFENQNFFEILKDNVLTSDKYYEKVLHFLTFELNRSGINMSCKPIKSRELKKLGLFGAEVLLIN